VAQSNLAIRLITGFIGAPLIVALLYLGPEWGWIVFMTAATLVGASELYNMTHDKDPVSRWILALVTAAIPALLFYFGDNTKVLITMFLVIPVASMFLVLARLGDMKTAAQRVMAGGFGPLYLGGGLATLALMRRDGGQGFIILSLTIAWASDTTAYFAGRFLGKHKLYEAVSPKKTIEGALGGLVGSVIGALVGHFWYVKTLSIPHAVGIAVIGGAAGQAGDLGESLLKRSFGIKDSGGIVPGHGGILDRVDALLVTGTICYLYVLWIR
jgi:phosphatidate cytidylyltransferase